MFRPGMGVASPSISVSSPAMILSRLDLPEPFTPSTPILAPGKKLRETSLRICRLGGTILPTLFMVNTYLAIRITLIKKGKQRKGNGLHAACGKTFQRLLQVSLQTKSTHPVSYTH